MVLRRFRLRSKVVKPGCPQIITAATWYMVSYRIRKLKHLTALFADESVEYTIKGISIQYELLECAIKGKLM